jgi:hypothetical protein
MRALCLRWIWKGPMQTLSRPWKNRTAGRFGFRTYGDDVGEKQTCLEDIEHSLRFLFRDIDADFAHHFDRERIQRAGLKACALRFKEIAATCVEKSFRHLAPRAVVHADEKNALSHNHISSFSISVKFSLEKANTAAFHNRAGSGENERECSETFSG